MPPALWIAGAGVGLWLVWGDHGAVGYDPGWSLIWGDQIAHGELPALERPVAPTPHPLSNLVAALLSPLGAGAIDALLLLSGLSVAALAWAAYRLGRVTFGAAAGVLCAVLVVTRPLIVNGALQAMLDVPFLALVLWSAALVAERPRRGLFVFVPLGLAGLLRPEAWLLAGAYALWLWFRASGRQRLAFAAAAVAAPVLWALFDLAATGDPLHSLHGTQELATLLRRPRDEETAVLAVSPYLGFILTERVMFVGFAGALASALLLYPRSVVPSLVLWAGLATFVCLGIAGLPVLMRYLLVPAAILCLFAAVVVFGWRLADRRGLRTAWIAAAVVGAAVLVADTGDERDQIDSLASRLAAEHRADDALRSLTGDARVRRASKGCRRVLVEGSRDMPLTAYLLERDPLEVVVRPARPADGLFIAFTSRPAPAGFRRVAGNPWWTAFSDCA